jgi:hypothetical protein
MAGGRFGDQEIHNYLALRRQQGPEPAQARPQQRHIRGDKAVEKVARVLAADLDHAAVGRNAAFIEQNSLVPCQTKVSAGSTQGIGRFSEEKSELRSNHDCLLSALLDRVGTPSQVAAASRSSAADPGHFTSEKGQ